MPIRARGSAHRALGAALLPFALAAVATLVTPADGATAPQRRYTLGQSAVDAPEDRFGASFAIDDTHVLVGSPFPEDAVASAQLFRADTGAFTRVLLDPADSGADRSFGSGVALVGGDAAVGAPGQNVVHVFAAATGALLRSIPSPTPGARGFGARLAAVGAALLVGTYGDAAYLVDPASGDVLHPFDEPIPGGNGLGGPIAGAPGLIVVSASAPAGRVVRVFDPATGASLATLVDPDAAPASGFGSAVAIVDGRSSSARPARATPRARPVPPTSSIRRRAASRRPTATRSRRPAASAAPSRARAAS